jgi:ribose transport system substrate-binding protein
MGLTRSGLTTMCCVAVAITVGACGSSSSPSQSSSSAAGTNAAAAATSASSSSSSGSSGSYVATATKLVNQAYEGTYRNPPASGPPAQKGKTVWVISCGLANAGCALPAQAIQQAGKTLGWNVKIFDGKLDPSTFNGGITQALAAHANAIITIAIDCPLIKQGLTAAKAAHVPTVGLYSYDCSSPAYGNGPKLFTAEMNYGEPDTQFFQHWGALHSDYAIAKTNGKAKVIIFTGPEYQTTIDEADGMESELAKCSTCTLVAKVPMPATTLHSGVAAQSVTTTLSKYPDANVIMFNYDAQLFATSQAIQRAQRSGLIVIGGEGYFPSLIKSGVETAGVTTDATWMGYAGADTANRLMAGQTTIPDSGWGFQIVDKTHGLTSSGTIAPPKINFVAAFDKVWEGK